MPTIVLELSDIQPFHRGFFCDDESIRYPYYDSTVPAEAVGVVGILLPAIIVNFHK